jgi:hypothetical protein
VAQWFANEKQKKKIRAVPRSICKERKIIYEVELKLQLKSKFYSIENKDTGQFGLTSSINLINMHLLFRIKLHLSGIYAMGKHEPHTEKLVNTRINKSKQLLPG